MAYPAASGQLTIISRTQWGARSPHGVMERLSTTPTYVFIHHGASGECFDEESCKQTVRSYQNYHMDSHGWNDIGYSFVVGEDGNVYEGRGWDQVGAHTYGYNRNGIGICIIGDFTNKVPNDAALNAVNNLIRYGLSHLKISPQYTLKGHRDVGNTECPGNRLYQLIQTWPHFASNTQVFS